MRDSELDIDHHGSCMSEKTECALTSLGSLGRERVTRIHQTLPLDPMCMGLPVLVILFKECAGFLNGLGYAPQLNKGWSLK